MRRPGLTLLLSLALLAGCGGDDKKDREPAKAAKPVEPPKAKTTLKVAADELSAAIASGDCEAQLERMLPSSVRGTGVKPGDPPRPGECKQVEAIAQSLAGFEPTKVREFGPAGVVEANGDEAPEGDVLASSWVLDRDGEWKFTEGSSFDPQIGEEPRLSSEFDEAAERFVDAARTGGCDVFFRLAHPYSRFVAATKNDEVEFCNKVAESYKRPGSELRELAGDPSAKPEKLGETLDMAWYAVRMKTGRYWVVVLWSHLRDTPRNLAKGHPGEVGVMDYISVTSPGG
jgi:hypothetical protein